MQGSLEKFKTGSTTMPICNASDFNQLLTELPNMFNFPTNLRIDLINDLREIRNSSGHSGETKTKQNAIDYLKKANDFLDKWIAEKK